ncbi:MAG: 16S rRNA (guanine(966)-N(2))-methyltransferase RsmD [Chloroflexi bacterium RBG_16_50_11]|nr:MAG: 16S rRNA (guanine(966)-N(2))-methyltransferase RsmD [Chloroflexi bacterium RBG_16_50_11]
MRVITGKAKGHHLKFPSGTKTRPVTDLVRGAIFSMLDNIASDWSQVLDLFSGSGALGIESLSRGAGWVDFVESERKCCDIIKENLATTGFSAQARVYCCSVNKALSFLDKEYNIILMDPPYSNPTTGDILNRLAISKLVGADTTLVVTHSARSPLHHSYATLNLVKEHRHGDSCISIFQKEAIS